MTAQPLATDSLSLPARLLDPGRVWAGLDQGGSLLKLLFVAKEDFGKELVTVHSYLYACSDLDAALQVIRERCYMPPGPRPMLNVTGVGYWRLYQHLEAQLGVKTTFIDEFVSQARGALAVLSHSSREEALLPLPANVKLYARSSQPIMAEAQRTNAAALTRNNHEDGLIIPANFLVLGSAPVAMHVDKSGKPVPIAVSRLGGLPFLGLTKLLLGTADYEEVMQLAAKGDIRNLFTQVKDIVGNNKTDYGIYDIELPYMPFGKLHLGLGQNPRREDVAASLVAVFAQIAFHVALHIARATGISRIYVSGNWIRSEVARRALCEQWNLTVPDNVIEFKFLKCGVTTCLGAMLNSTDIDEKLSNV